MYFFCFWTNLGIILEINFFWLQVFPTQLVKGDKIFWAGDHHSVDTVPWVNIISNMNICENEWSNWSISDRGIKIARVHSICVAKPLIFLQYRTCLCFPSDMRYHFLWVQFASTQGISSHRLLAGQPSVRLNAIFLWVCCSGCERLSELCVISGGEHLLCIIRTILNKYYLSTVFGNIQTTFSTVFLTRITGRINVKSEFKMNFSTFKSHKTAVASALFVCENCPRTN